MQKLNSIIVIVILALLAMVITACEKDSSSNPENGLVYNGFNLQDVGFQTPESMLYDADSDIYFVSNINGSPIARDDNGFISKVNPDGEVETLKWLDGETEEYALHAPKGMAISGNRFYVTDITGVKIFQKNNGSFIEEINIAGSTFLNDLTPSSDGGVYVSDYAPSSESDAVYHISPEGVVTAMIQDPNLGSPNGLCVSETHGLLVVNAGGVLSSIDPDGLISLIATLPSGGLDGIVETNDGRLLISSWEASLVYSLNPPANPQQLVGGIESPADIGYDSKRDLVLIPVFLEDRIVVRPASF